MDPAVTPSTAIQRRDDAPAEQAAPGGPGASPGPPPLLRVENLHVHYPVGVGLLPGRSGHLLRAVDGVDLELPRGETLGLVGESGCGKSTTARAIARLVRPTSGAIWFDGVDLARLEGRALRRLRPRIQMVFQDPYSSLDPLMSIHDIVAEPLDVQRMVSGRARTERVAELLNLVGLRPELMHRFPHEFSGGQRQRIGIARALATHPDLLVADEPVSALDVSIRAQVVNLLQDLQERLGLTYVFISHDLHLVRHLSSRVAVMYLGKIVETGAAATVHDAPVHPYTVALLSAAPVPDPAVEARRRRIVLRGDVPSPLTPPTGCRFHTRCWLRERLGRPEACERVEPSLVAFGPQHAVACHFATEVDGSAEQRQATIREPSTVAQSGPGGEEFVREVVDQRVVGFADSGEAADP